MNQQPEWTNQTRQNLVEAFWHLYRTKRIEKITIKEITDRAGYNRSTFYAYFTDVYAVLEHVEQELLDKLHEVMAPTMPRLNTSDSRDMETAFALPLEALVRLYEENGNYFTVLLGDHGDPAFLSKVKSSFKPLLKTIVAGHAGSARDFELDYTLEYILSSMIGILSYWFSQTDRPPLDKLVALMKELTNEGVIKTIQTMRLMS